MYCTYADDISVRTKTESAPVGVLLEVFHITHDVISVTTEKQNQVRILYVNLPGGKDG